jgi:hypothetical protein
VTRGSSSATNWKTPPNAFKSGSLFFNYQSTIKTNTTISNYQGVEQGA